MIYPIVTEKGDSVLPEFKNMKFPSAIENQICFVAIRAFAAHSYLYYEKDSPVISDTEFDELCLFINENFDIMKKYDINNYLGNLEDNKDRNLKTGFDIAKKVCGQTKDYAEKLLDGSNKKKK